MAIKTLSLDIEKKYWQKGPTILAGIDEAGRGPLAGPVVAAAVIFPPGHQAIEGINDSKKISEKKREELYDKISSQSKAVGIGLVDSKAIDNLNIVNATYKAMRMAIGRTKCNINMLLVDGRPLKNSIISQEAIVGGDSKCYSIAAASIIAKVYRDRLMAKYHKIFPQYNFAKHKGYGTKEHCEAIEKFGACPIHRYSFKRVTGFEFDLKKITNNRTIGSIGENHAAWYLYQQNYEIIERNYHFSNQGEIDIIARDGNVLIFVEVKTIRQKMFGKPEDKVDEFKQEQLYKIAEAYLAEQDTDEMECRFDIISVNIEDNKFYITHFKDAFRL